jgi:all-trans-retinol 13,14-reductase
LLEQHGKTGGCCHTFKAGGHFEFDTGIHFVGNMHNSPRSLGTLLKKLTDGQLQWEWQGEVYDSVK